MSDQERRPEKETKEQENQIRIEDLKAKPIAADDAEGVKGGSVGWDVKANIKA